MSYRVIELLETALNGLALWRDGNSNGVSEADEIAFSPEGGRFADGRTRPTFDVVLYQRGAALR